MGFFFFPSSSSFLTCFFSVSDDSLDLAAAAFYFSILPNLHTVYKNVPRCVIVSVCILKLISPLVEKKKYVVKLLYIFFFRFENFRRVPHRVRSIVTGKKKKKTPIGLYLFIYFFYRTVFSLRCCCC